MNGYDILDALKAIDPAGLHYDSWLAVGQALHHEGYPCETWRSWTAGDVRKDHRHRLAKLDYKWGTFGKQAGTPVTGGTIVKMAHDAGWRGGWTDEGGREHHALSWDSTIGGGKKGSDDAESVLIDSAMVGDDAEEVSPMFPEGHGVEELRSLLSAMFDDDEKIGYVTECEYDEEHGKWKPASRGVYTRTMKDVYDAVYRDGIENGLSATLNGEAGAFVRINPLDGKGVGNANVAAYRHALVESDTMAKGKFAAIVKQLNLPIVALIDSGNKSLHAIVRIDAADERQYKERVELLYERCLKNGIDVDRANKNPSRMTRMPGVMRNGSRQFLAGLAQGAGDWEEWCEWYDEATDELPDVESLEEAFTNPEELNPELIKGVLRVGHKMLLSGPSKAGKSFALLHLAVAFAEGWAWLGLECRKSRVLYVNLEVDRKSFKQRFADVYGELERVSGLKRTNAQAVSVWNLRGKVEPMGKLLPKLIRRAVKCEADVVIIDPIYKVMTGDENSASDMAAFGNLFDELCDKADVSAIYCHHHSKGYQGAKRAIDRASGSGVFGRDPDAILDMTEIDIDSSTLLNHANDAICKMCADAVAEAGGGDVWANLPDAARKIERNAFENACDLIGEDAAGKLRERRDQVLGAAPTKTAWRITSTLREFAARKPIDVWFDWPLFIPDEELAGFGEVGAEDAPAKPRGRSNPSRNRPSASIAPDDPKKAFDEINSAHLRSRRVLRRRRRGADAGERAPEDAEGRRQAADEDGYKQLDSREQGMVRMEDRGLR